MNQVSLLSRTERRDGQNDSGAGIAHDENHLRTGPDHDWIRSASSGTLFTLSREIRCRFFQLPWPLRMCAVGHKGPSAVQNPIGKVANDGLALMADTTFGPLYRK